MIVYKLQCNTCNKSYIGSTKQKFHDRVSQHHSAKSSVIFKHNYIHNKSSDYSYKIIQQCRSIKELLFSEAIIIKQANPELNRQAEREDVLQFIS